MKFIKEKVLSAILKFINTKGVAAVKNGMIRTIPVIITGSIFLILAQLPIESWAKVVADCGLQEVFFKAYSATFQIEAIVAVFAIAYEYASSEKIEPYGAGITAMCAFFVLAPNTIKVDLDTLGNSVSAIAAGINLNWTAGQGMVGAILVGLIVGFVYSKLIKKDVRIKMPDSVPKGVSNSFAVLIPCIIILMGATIIHAICYYTSNTTFMELFYNVIASRLQNLSDTLGGAITYIFLVGFMWIFGVHGSAVMSGTMGALLQANGMENQQIFLSLGGDLSKWSVNTPGVHIITQQFIDQFLTLSGSGVTFGIVIYCLFFAKSSQFKSLGKVGLIPSLFNINEPFLFGIPICFNPIMAIPFIITPIAIAILEYVAILVGFIAPYTGVSVPWTTPPIISGFLVGATGGTGVQVAILQVVALAMSTIIYFPFLKIIDEQNVIAEKKKAEEKNEEDW